MTKLEYETIVQTTEIRRYKSFEGRNIDYMQRLLTGRDQETNEQVDVSRTLITLNQLIHVRLEGQSGDKRDLRIRKVDVNVTVTPNPNGDEVKFTIGDSQIETLTADISLEQGVLPTTQEQYDSKDGFVLSGSEVKKFWNNPYALPDKRREFWEFLAEESDLSKRYEKDVTESSNMDYDNVQGICLPESKGLRLLSIYAVGSNRYCSRSDADGSKNLSSGIGRLVGVALEAQEMGELREPRARTAPEKILENRIQTALDKGRAFRYNGKLYVPTDADLEIK